MALLGVGVLALVLQGAVATIVPPPLCPDFALLVVIAIALHWQRAASGLLLAFTLGYAADSPKPKERNELDEIVCWDRWS